MENKRTSYLSQKANDLFSHALNESKDVQAATARILAELSLHILETNKVLDRIDDHLGRIELIAKMKQL